MESILKIIKNEFDTVISTAKFNGKVYSNGQDAKQALIRSQKIINYIHEYIKKEFVKNGINKINIYPPIDACKPELKIKGYLKSKNQDVCVVPDENYAIHAHKGDPLSERIIAVNIRSQLSSLQKNIDTLYERTFAEALNLHLKYPKQCLGEVYLIPTHEYDDKAMEQNKVVFKNQSRIENYIRMFQAINKRGSEKIDDYKYERVCLLVADFRNIIPKLYSTTSELKKDGLVKKDFDVELEELSLKNFVKDLIKVYNSRFNKKTRN